MGRFQRVREILDEAVGGPGATVGFHGAVCRGTTRDEFIAIKVFGKDLVIVGDGAASNLVLALKGQPPFGADLPEPPVGASINRMPSGRDPVPAEWIAFIKQWIDDGCPDDVPPPAGLTWRPTNAPVASSRTDDNRRGATWTGRANLPPLAPSAVCGLSVVDESVVYASGTTSRTAPRA